MTPEDIITDLSAHLHRQGVTFNRANLDAFAADMRHEPTIGRDIEALAQRFRDSQEAAARALRRKRVRVWVQQMCAAGIGAVFLGFGVLFWLFLLCDRPSLPSVGASVDTLMILIGACPSALGVALLAAGFAGAVRTSRRLTAEIDRMEKPDGES